MKPAAVDSALWDQLYETYVDDVHGLDALGESAALVGRRRGERGGDGVTRGVVAGQSQEAMAKVGPMLGLMRTLIRLGPALIGLSSGDLQTLAANLIVAFATTVVGLASGGIGFVAAQSQARWFTEDLNNLEFVESLLAMERPVTGEEERALGHPEEMMMS